MNKIPKKRKDEIIAKMSGPQRISIPQLAKEEKISKATLYGWRAQARLKGELLPDHDNAPEGWSAQDKFNTVLQTATMSESQLSEFCRTQGLYPEQVQRWKEACQKANNWDVAQSLHQNKQSKLDKKKIRTLEKDLQRKEKALAEAAALMILQKKAHAIWGDEDA